MSPYVSLCFPNKFAMVGAFPYRAICEKPWHQLRRQDDGSTSTARQLRIAAARLRGILAIYWLYTGSIVHFSRNQVDHIKLT